MSTTQKLPRVFRSSPHHARKTEKSSLLTNPGSLIVAAFGSLFVAYIFNFRGIATSIDGYFGGVNQAAQSHSQAVSTIFLHALPAIVGAMVLVLMLIFLRASGGGSKAKAKSRKKAVDTRGVEAFVEAAATEGISPRVARSAYRVLLPYVRRNKYLGIDDTLFQDLRLSEDQLSDVYGSLLRLSDRRRRPGDEGAGIRGVTGLMMAVESSEDKIAGTDTGKIARQNLAIVPAAAQAAVSSAVPAGFPVAAMATAPDIVPQPVAETKPKKPGAVLVHPARLPRRELSMMRSRAMRSYNLRSL